MKSFIARSCVFVLALSLPLFVLVRGVFAATLYDVIYHGTSGGVASFTYTFAMSQEDMCNECSNWGLTNGTSFIAKVLDGHYEGTIAFVDGENVMVNGGYIGISIQIPESEAAAASAADVEVWRHRTIAVWPYENPFSSLSMASGTANLASLMSAGPGSSLLAMNVPPTSSPGPGSSGTGSSGSGSTSGSAPWVGPSTGIPLPNEYNPTMLVSKFQKYQTYIIGIGVLASLFIIPIIGIMLASGNPETIEKGMEWLWGFLGGLFLLIFSGVIIRIVGQEILGL